jgi:hypothetical protein
LVDPPLVRNEWVTAAGIVLVLAVGILIPFVAAFLVTR